jgi:hypothetical protein
LPRTPAARDSAFGLVHGDSTFDITGPTLITTFPISWQELDASEHAGDAIAEYKAYLSGAKPILRDAGIAVHANNDDVLRWHDSLGVHTISTVGDYAIVYVFVGADGRALTLRGDVQSDTAILDAARKHFGIALPKVPSQVDPTRGSQFVTKAPASLR